MAKRKKKIKDGIRAKLCQHLARVMAYYDHGYMDLAQWHARLLVGELVNHKLIDPALPLRPIDSPPPVAGGLTPGTTSINMDAHKCNNPHNEPGIP